jgi:hypothetical protein
VVPAIETSTYTEDATITPVLPDEAAAKENVAEVVEEAASGIVEEGEKVEDPQGQG